jgi:hypothetical protein
MFAIKAVTYPNGAPEKCSTRGKLLVLLKNIMLGRKDLPVTNTLAYYKHKFYNICPCTNKPEYL